MNLNSPRILGLGTCQLHNPIGHLDTQGEAISVLRRLRLSGDPYSFTPSEHLQTLRIMRGDVVAPRSILPFLPKHISNEKPQAVAAAIAAADVVLCEICNPVEIFFNGWQLNICSVLGEICGDAAKQDAETGAVARQWYYRGLMQGDDAIRADAAEKYLSLYIERDERSSWRREIVKCARARHVDDDALEAEFRNLNAAIGKPTGIVTHIIRYMPDGRPISWPPDFRNRVIDLAARVEVPLLDPCQLVSKHGLEVALMSDAQWHWAWDFMPTVAETYKGFLLSEMLQFVDGRADYG